MQFQISSRRENRLRDTPVIKILIYMGFATERFLEVTIESWPQWTHSVLSGSEHFVEDMFIMWKIS